MAIIEVKNLTKQYKTYKRGSSFSQILKSFFVREKVIINAVDDISFSIEKGEICGILGPNGAGKSTTIKMLCGSLYPTKGEINVMGFDPCKNRKKYVKEIGAVFGQRSQLIWDIPPIDSFKMNQAIYAIPNIEFEHTLKELCELFEIEEIIKKPTRVLSLGERMKCEFVMAMLHCPKIVFLDEPTIGLDVIAKNKIREFILKMNQKGVTFILTTHDLEDVSRLADRVIIINNGKKVFDDSISLLKQSLGDKKQAELTLNSPFKGELPKGTQLVSQKSELQITLEIDIQNTNIKDVISFLSNTFDFCDISIKELPMEKIITHLYKK